MATTKKITKKESPVRGKSAALRAARPSLTADLPRTGSLSEATIFSMEGKKVSTVTLPKSIFGRPWKSDLVHQVVTAMRANARQSRAHTKDRSEVSGGGRKPWKQKGTGQARHGSTRSPLWRHGGVTFGPRKERDYSEKINRKMRISALLSVLSRKAKDGEIVFVDAFAFAAPKTKEAVNTLAVLSRAAKARLLSNKGSNSALIALATYDRNVLKSFNNLKGIKTEEIRNLNPVDLLSYKYLVMEKPEKAFETLLSRARAR